MPSRITNTPTVVPTPTASGTYTVKSGDSLSAIARQHGTSLQALIDANSARYPTLATNPGAIQVGWQLALPNGANRPAPNSPQANTVARSNNDILLVGMNAHAKDEAAALRNRGQNVTFIGDSFSDDQLRVREGGQTRTHDLRTDEGINAFVLSLGLPGEQSRKVADAIRSVGADGRDEFAGLAREFARAEKGGTIPSRLVLSGHNVGSGIYGDDNGQIRWESMAKLTDAMPAAARQVEDLHVAACYSGGQPAIERYRAMFPNAKTIWAYSGSAPGTWSGAMPHQSRWETATRGTRAELDRALANGTRKGENVAVWSERLGYLDGNPPAELSTVRGEFDRGAATYDRFFAGEEAVSNTQSGPLRDYYNRLQRLLQHPDLPAAETPQLEARRDATIRLIYYSATVAPKFQQHHERQINEGFRALGLTAPNFGTLTRADALRQIEAFEQALNTASPQPEAAQQLLPLLTEGLRDLSSSRIPPAWV